MVSRSLVMHIDPPEVEDLRQAIYNHTDASIQAILLKDLHLIENAIASDQRVLSMDKRVCFHFSDLCGHIRVLRGIHWVHPLSESYSVRDWLIDGAPDEPLWTLGFQFDCRRSKSSIS